MHFSTKRRVVLGMTTGGLLMTGLGMASAHADTTATGETSHSPGIGSGNLIQLPVNAPINVCGNQIDVIGILDSVTGNSCSNDGGSAAGGSNDGTSASGDAKHSPGVGSGNLVQIPINAPINVCGNQVDVIGVGNTDHGNSCSNGGSGSTTASGSSKGSPGIGSGNVIQVPINAPVNVCGNQVDVIGILDSVTGNSCENNGGSTPTPPPPPPTPTPTPTQPTPTPTGCGCPPPPPPPPTTPCPPSGTTTSTPTSSAPGGGTPSSTASPTSTSSHGGSNGGSNGGTNGNGSSGKATGVLAHTGSGALAVAPLGAGLIGGGVLLRKRFPSRSH
ncbi:MAG TPA: chaplin [Actinocrinis sp.]|uniref:chaplin n=1 Tax=Actinocrinis sp. TaxID=1920516 RepID=UPI002D6EABB1|nr:chaplin [Actinocrinis sp.]HZU56933.1 chaplin [Actinocrinis sp.]